MGGSSKRRRSFDKLLERNARQWGLELSGTVEFLFRRRYNLSPNDPRFLDTGSDEMLVDMWAHRFTDDPKLKDEVINPDFEADLAEMEAEAAAGASDDPAAWEEVAAETYE